MKSLMVFSIAGAAAEAAEAATRASSRETAMVREELSKLQAEWRDWEAFTATECEKLAATKVGRARRNARTAACVLRTLLKPA